MRTIHWLGSGLSSTYGIDTLVENPKYFVHLWMRQPHKAFPHWRYASHVYIHPYTLDAFSNVLTEGDIVVSMLPYALHADIAKLALEKGAHFICTSYLSQALLDLEALAKKRRLILAGEMGLDPGIDHMLTHALVRQFKAENRQEDYTLGLLSLCGGIPANPGPFRYQFSWSPLGILRALRQSSTWLEKGKIYTAQAPYESVRTIQLNGEQLEYYPNRDSLPFIQYYQLPRECLDFFLRGSIRPLGWKDAWQGIFQQLPQLSEEELQQLSQKLFETYPYGANERDRVIMSIELHAKNRQNHRCKSYKAHLDVKGNARHHAMTTLVCIPLLTVIDGIAEQHYAPGILRPTASPEELERWLKALANRQITIHFEEVEGGDHEF